jgi:gas vesicle protein
MMMARDIKSWFFDALPFQRRSGAWILPSLVGLGVGVAAGVGIGLLVAPEPGEATRQRIARGAEDLQRKATRLVDKSRGELERAGREIAGEARAEMTSGGTGSSSART